MSNVQRLLAFVDQHGLRLHLTRSKGGWESYIIGIQVDGGSWPFGPARETPEGALEGLAEMLSGKSIAVEVTERVETKRPIGVFGSDLMEARA